MKEYFINVNNDVKKLQKVINEAQRYKYIMANDFNCKIPNAKTLLQQFKKYYHGNSKMIIHLNYNNITGHKELSFGTKTIYNSYPQYKKIDIIKL